MKSEARCSFYYMFPRDASFLKSVSSAAPPGELYQALIPKVAEHPGDHLSMGFQVVGDGLMGDARPGDFRRLEMKEAASFYYMERSMTSSFFRAVQ